jgi:hypothetical protein
MMGGYVGVVSFHLFLKRLNGTARHERANLVRIYVVIHGESLHSYSRANPEKPA